MLQKLISCWVKKCAFPDLKSCSTSAALPRNIQQKQRELWSQVSSAPPAFWHHGQEIWLTVPISR